MPAPLRKRPRFEIVRTHAGYHARFRAANGQIVWTTEVYVRRRSAYAAIRSIDGFHLGPVIDVDNRLWTTA